MKKWIVVLISSLLLIVVSAPPLYLMGQEILLQQKVNHQYKIETTYHPIDRTTDPFNNVLYLEDGKMKPFPEMTREVYMNDRQISGYDEFIHELDSSEEHQLSRVVSYYNTEIAIVDTFARNEDSEGREKATVQILIDGENYAEPVPLEIRPNYLDNNRYHGYLGMLKMTTNSTQEEELMIIQRLFEENFAIPEEGFKWKVIAVNKEGEVRTELFSRESIDSPAYRRDLINKAHVSPYALGYKSNVLQGYPSLFYPLFYPFGTMGIGILILVMGIVTRTRR